MTDEIQTVQIDYAEAMEMLWRQSQTIKWLQQENEKLRSALKPFADESRVSPMPGESNDHRRCSMKFLKAAAAALKEDGNE